MHFRQDHIDLGFRIVGDVVSFCDYNKRLAKAVDTDSARRCMYLRDQVL